MAAVLSRDMPRNVDNIFTSWALSMTQDNFYFIGIILKAICKISTGC